MSKKCPDRIRYQREHYACYDLNCKANHDAEYILLDLHESALATVRREAFKDAIKIIDEAGEEWGDQARARKSKTYSAYVIAALDLKGRIEAALEASASDKGDDAKA